MKANKKMREDLYIICSSIEVVVRAENDVVNYISMEVHSGNEYSVAFSVLAVYGYEDERHVETANSILDWVGSICRALIPPPVR